jgi:photosystem II stability/assembly factor-like uncharacterized protein
MSAAVALFVSTQTGISDQPASEHYVWKNVVIGGGGFVTGLVFHPSEKNLLYARTDVGGAYRWDDTGQRWIPLTDWLGPADNNLMGIESVALDPRDPKRVYLAAGTYRMGKAAILRSDDQGQTFQRTDVPFKMGGNEAGRFSGERLAVDPNNGAILFFGSRWDGLWKSTDRGATWQPVASFPIRPQPIGIVSVVFDPVASNIFAAASTPETNLFVSADAGTTWQAVTNQPVGLRPNHLVRAPDGMLYLTYTREPGPNDVGDGAVWTFDPKAGIWTDITPLRSPDQDHRFGYGAVAVDAQHPATIMVTTLCHWKPHDLIFRSTNRGKKWTQLWRDDTEWDHSRAPYTRTHTPHWMGSLAINPSNSDQVLFTTGYGIWSSVNATQSDSGKPTRWVFFNDGLEETVPLALISPPVGAPLISGLGDIDGFRHDDLTVSPPQGSFAGPRYGNTEDLAFAGKNPHVLVRTGTAGGQTVRAAVSRDGGTTWQELGSEPPAGNGAGHITISADARTIVWTPRGDGAYFTRDCGTNWMACAGLSGEVRVVADTVNPQKFYAFNSRSGRFLRSTNGAAKFASQRATGPSSGAMVYATPGNEDDVWLAARSGGLYHSTNGGANFIKLERVRRADSLGFGKAARGKDYPALFLAGEVERLRALYRSDDAGKNWVRINDDQHQYGSISRVTGDPRIYGRVYFATGGRGVIYGDMR